MHRDFCLLIALIMAGIWGASACSAATFTRTVEVPLPEVSYADGKAALLVEGFPGFGDPGEPILPIHTFSILLPSGEDVDQIEVEAFESEEIILDLPLEWGQPQAPRGMDISWEPAGSEAAIYDDDRPFPPRAAVHVTTQTFRGYNIAYFRVYPVRYVGRQRRLICSRSLRVTVETAPAAGMLARSAGTLRPHAERDIAGVRGLADDFTAAATYALPNSGTGGSGRQAHLLGSGLVDPDRTYPFLIITTNAFKPAFEVLKQHRDSQGLTTAIVTLPQITSYYSGLDLQDRIRQMITDAYLNWGTEYVLLGADDGAIPHRGFYAEILPYVTDADIPADIYYGALDGTWNDDGDGRWGEPGEDDLLPEVSVGRVSVSSLTEADNYVNKVIRYETAPVTSQIKVAQMAGELIYDEPTWGGDEKEEVRLGSSAHGFTTTGFPPSFTVHTLYDKDLYPAEWSAADLIALMNSGRHIINHSGHCINWMCMKIDTSVIPTSFTNDGISNSYMVIYAHGCYSAAFDNRTTDGSYVGDAVAEYFTFIENGAVAYIGNTRYGCGFHGDTRSAAQYYDREFFDALFGEGISVIGDAFTDSKVDNIPYIDFRGMRWTYYTLTLIGDPAMDIWTDIPGTLTVDAPPEIGIPDNSVEIAVTGGGSPVEGARVSLFSDSTCYCHGFTDSEGLVHLDPALSGPGSVYVAVRAHDFYGFLDSIPVVDPAGALILVEAVTVDDDEDGASSGNSNGMVDAGETVEMSIALRNAGPLLAEEVSALLRCDDPHVTLIDSAGAYADIPPGQVASPVWAFGFEVEPETPDGHLIEFDLEITSADTVVGRHFSAGVLAPELRPGPVSIDDTAGGNGDLCVEPGETFDLTLHIENSGRGSASGLSISVSENDPYASLASGSAYIAGIGPDTTIAVSPAFEVELLPGTPALHRLDLEVEIDLADGLTVIESTAVHVGGLVDEDFEAGSPGWTHGDIIAGFLDQWHLDTYRNHTGGGAQCWKFGGEGSTEYAHYAHGALVTPQLCLAANA
ncbi:MAG: C25 family cysteine peptidase, partial [bacterium]